MALIQVDIVGLEPRQAGVDLLGDLRGAQPLSLSDIGKKTLVARI